MNIGEMEIIADSSLPPGVILVTPDFGNMTLEEYNEFWEDPCWADYFGVITLEEGDELNPTSN